MASLSSVVAAAAAVGAASTPQLCPSGFCGARSRHGDAPPRARASFPRPSTGCCCKASTSLAAQLRCNTRPLLSGHQRLLNGAKAKSWNEERFNARWRRNSHCSGDLLNRSHASEQLGCSSCFKGQHRHHYHSHHSASRVFLDKSTFFLRKQFFGGINVNQVRIPCATVGPDEPHAASMTWPDTIADREVLWNPETEAYDLDGFLNSQLPSHPKLHRGQLKNGLRYLILPNKVPANRFEAHMEVHVGSIDEDDDEQGIAHMIEHVAFLGSKKREKLLGTGARSNAYTDFHHTVFHIHSPTSTKVFFVLDN
ncbi:hypothetical protein Taro_005482 [Colocasia esculenta]|uniref:Peptidase M16 N-terminal domain-containing protein n=1 Tax=Colocasia esculenta TaxID=4460 RepID=A0A843TQ19_COLES|nr:hypothetical protein [Colocasia esculenta]